MCLSSRYRREESTQVFSGQTEFTLFELTLFFMDPWKASIHMWSSMFLQYIKIFPDVTTYAVKKRNENPGILGLCRSENYRTFNALEVVVKFLKTH